MYETSTMSSGRVKAGLLLPKKNFVSLSRRSRLRVAHSPCELAREVCRSQRLESRFGRPFSSDLLDDGERRRCGAQTVNDVEVTRRPTREDENTQHADFVRRQR